MTLGSKFKDRYFSSKMALNFKHLIWYSQKQESVPTLTEKLAKMDKVRSNMAVSTWHINMTIYTGP